MRSFVRHFKGPNIIYQCPNGIKPKIKPSMDEFSTSMFSHSSEVHTEDGGNRHAASPRLAFHTESKQIDGTSFIQMGQMMSSPHQQQRG